jgi:hypothetical protein
MQSFILNSLSFLPEIAGRSSRKNVLSPLGETIAVTAVPVSALEALRDDEVLSVRPLAHTESLDRR